MFAASKNRRLALALVVSVGLVAPATHAAAAGTTPVPTTSTLLSAPDTGCSSMPSAQLPSTLASTGTTSTVSGKVTSGTGTAVANAMVIAIDPSSGAFIGCKDTDAAGNYSFTTSATTVQLIAGSPKGSAGANLAGTTQVFAVESGTTVTKNLSLATADLAIGFTVPAENSLVDINAHYMVACLVDPSAEGAARMLTCGISRDRSTTSTPRYDVRLASSAVAAGKANVVGVYAFGMVATPNGMKTLENFNAFDNPDRPVSRTRLDDIKTAYATSLAGTANQVKFEMKEAGSGGGEQGGGMPTTNCAEGQTPFLNGTVTTPTGAPAANAWLRLRAVWITVSNGVPTGKGWINGWGDDSSYFVGTAADGKFNLCRIAADANNQEGGSTGGGTSGGTAWIPEGAIVRFIAVISPSLAPDDHSQATTFSAVGDPVGSTSLKQCVIDPAATCSLSLSTMAPKIEGYVKTPSGDPVQYAQLSVYDNYGTAENLQWAPNALLDMNTSATGWFGFATNIGAGSLYKLTARPPYCEEDPCPYAGLSDASAYFMGGADASWSGQVGSSKDITLQQANFTGVLTNADGNPLMYQNLYFECTGTDTSGCTPISAYTNWSDGSFAVRLPDGTFSLTIYGQSNNVIETTFSITVSGGVVTSVQRTAPGATADICGGTAAACTEYLALSTAAPNFSMLVQDDTGVAVESAYINIESFNGNMNGYPWSWAANAETGNDNPKWGTPGIPGVAGANLQTDTIYKLRVNPPWDGSSDATLVEMFIKTATAPSGALVAYRCKKWNQNPSEPALCENGYYNDELFNDENLLDTVSDGKGGQRFVIVMPTANFKATLCRPGEPCTVVPNAWVQVDRLVETTYTDFQGIEHVNKSWQYASGSSTNTLGYFSLSLESTGAYKLVLNQPWNQQTRQMDTELTRTEVRIWVDVDDNGAATVSLADLDGKKIEGSSLPMSGVRYQVHYATPSLIGTVADPNGGTGAQNSNVEVFTPSTDSFCTGCRQWFTSAQTDSSGNFSMNLPDGKYTLRANPSWSAEGLTARELDVRLQDCDSDGTSEVYAGAVADCSGSPTPLQLTAGRLVISLGGSNFTGTLYNPLTSPEPTAVSWSGYNFEKWNGTNWQWQNSWGNTNQAGRFGLDLGAVGRYRVTFNAPWNLRSQLSDARVVLDVAEVGGQLVATPDVSASGGAAVISADGDTGRWNVSFPLPNASGRILTPTGDAGVGSAWINVQKWFEAGTGNCWNSGCWQWSGEVSGTNSNGPDGTFAMNLPQGHWRLQVNPPYYALDYTMAEVNVLVDDSGSVCIAEPSVATCPDADKILPGAFDIRLGSPNLTGYVVTESFTPNPSDGGPPESGWSGQRSRWSQVRFEKWSSDYDNWQWANVWAQTNNNGYFSQNVRENGVYRVNFEPSWQLSDYSAVTKYLAVCLDGAKVKYIDESQVDGWNCSDGSTLADMDSSINLSIVLRGANMRGIVKYDGEALGDVWVSMMSCTTSVWGGESCYWVKGVNTPRADWNPTNVGKFNFRVDNESSTPVKYRLEFNPPWNSTVGLVRQQVDVYFADFDPGTEGTEYCFSSDYTPNSGDPTTGTCADSHGDAYNWEVTMTAGNLAGKVVTPTAECAAAETCFGIASSSIQVEKWAQMPWNPSMYGWTWQPLWANSTGNSFTEDVANGNFGLNIDTAGVYRLTVNPGWNNPNSYSRATYVVTVADGDNWCVNEGVPSNSLNPNEATPSQATCTPTGKDNVPGDTVTGFTAKLVGSNLSGVLFDATATLPADKDDNTKKVADTWMSLQKEVTNEWCWAPGQCYTWTYWNWVSGANTSNSAGSKGKFGFSISEPGNYRIEFYPAWNNTNAATQFRQDFTVAETEGCVAGNSDPTLCTIPATLDEAVLDGSTYLIKYPSPNFAGTMYDKNGAAGGTKVGGAWISVVKAGTNEWVGGTSTTWNGPKKGDFALRIENDGDYRVEIHPPWDQPDAGMRRVVRVTIAGGAVTRIVNGGETDGAALCGDQAGESPCGSSLTLSLLGPNVSGHVYYPGASDTAADAYAAANPGEQTVMPWASAQAWKCTVGTWADPSSLQCNTWSNWSNSEQDGSLRFAFDSDGIYRVQVWPNYGLFTAGAIEAEVKIEGGAMAAWRYRGGDEESLANGFTPDFGRRKPNVAVTVGGVDDSRFVQISQCAIGSSADAGETAGECVSAQVLQRIASVYNSSSGTWKVSLNLEPGIYRIAVVRKSTDACDPTDASDIVEVTADDTDTNPKAVALDLASTGAGCE